MEFLGSNAFNYNLELYTKEYQRTFSKISRSYAANFSPEVNNSLNWPDKLVINNISPLIDLPSTEPILEIKDLTRQGDEDINDNYNNYLCQRNLEINVKI